MIRRRMVIPNTNRNDNNNSNNDSDEIVHDDPDEVTYFLESAGGRVPITQAVKPEPFGIVQCCVIVVFTLIVGIGLFLVSRDRTLQFDPLHGHSVVKIGGDDESINMRCVLINQQDHSTHALLLNPNIHQLDPGSGSIKNKPHLFKATTTTTAIPNTDNNNEINNKYTAVILGHSGTFAYELQYMLEGIVTTKQIQDVSHVVIGLVRSVVRFPTYVKLTQEIFSQTNISVVICDTYDKEKAWRGLWDLNLIQNPFIIFDHAMDIDYNWLTWLQETKQQVMSTTTTTTAMAQQQNRQDVSLPEIDEIAGFSLEAPPHSMGKYHHPRYEVHNIPGVGAFSPLPKIWHKFLVWYDDHIEQRTQDQQLYELSKNKDGSSSSNNNDHASSAHKLLFKHNRFHSDYARWFIQFTREFGLVTIHASSPPLARVHIRKPGEQDRYKMMSDNILPPIKTTQEIRHEVENTEREKWQQVDPTHLGN
jgi:hypothetical protein